MPDVRPIDANALVSAFNTDLQAAMISWSTDLLQALIIEIEEAPTLDYAPVRHGEWKLFGEKPITIRVDEWVVCSECNRDFMRITGIWFNYCPYCGAKMDGGQHDH